MNNVHVNAVHSARDPADPLPGERFTRGGLKPDETTGEGDETTGTL